MRGIKKRKNDGFDIIPFSFRHEGVVIYVENRIRAINIDYVMMEPINIVTVQSIFSFVLLPYFF
jgi:hypothetical protein